MKRIFQNYVTSVFGLIIILITIIQFAVGNFGWLLSAGLFLLGVALFFCKDFKLKGG